jgi:pentatricopeptide repeat protein
MTKRAQEVFVAVKKLNKLDALVYNAALDSYGKAGKVTEMLALFDEVKKEKEVRCKPWFDKNVFAHHDSLQQEC